MTCRGLCVEYADKTLAPVAKAKEFAVHPAWRHCLNGQCLRLVANILIFYVKYFFVRAVSKLVDFKNGVVQDAC